QDGRVFEWHSEPRRLRNRTIGRLRITRCHRPQAAERALEIRALQQAAVAELGQFALAETRLDRVMNRVTFLVSQTLAVDSCEVLEAGDEPASGGDGKEAAA